ncbi:MAG: alpha/beta hydrolase fold domain-containing protein, partial [Phycisphaerae bacterium]
MSGSCGSTSSLIDQLTALAIQPAGPVDVEFDRPFATRAGVKLKMDLFRPAATEEPLPVVVLVHGGFYLFGERSMMHAWAKDLAVSGYTAVAIHYRVIPEGGVYPAPIADILAAIAHLRTHAAELKIDPERIALFGISAGGHLALLAGMADDASVFTGDWPEGSSARVRAIVDVYGPTDFTADPAAAAPWQLQLVSRFLGGDLEEFPDLWREASPVIYARADGPAVLVIHGGSWRRGSRKQLALHAWALARAGMAAFAIDYRL